MRVLALGKGCQYALVLVPTSFAIADEPAGKYPFNVSSNTALKRVLQDTPTRFY